MFLDASINLTGINSYKNIYEDVYVDLKTSTVLDAKIKPIYETLYEVLFWWKETFPGKDMVDPALRSKATAERYNSLLEVIETIDDEDVQKAKVLGPEYETLFALSAQGWYPYGHIHDALLRLFPWRDEKLSNPKVLVSSNVHRVVDFPLHVEAMGYAQDQIHRQIWLKHRLVKVSKLYFGVNEARYWTTSSQEQYDWMIKGYLNLLTPEQRRLPKIEGLYLSRNHVGRRGVLNDDKVQSYLTERGFQTLTGAEGLRDIISLFNRAKVVVAPHGSILVNTIFCPEDTKVIEYCPDNRPDFSFYRKLKAVKDYRHILMPADQDFNIEIDLNGLAKELEE